MSKNSKKIFSFVLALTILFDVVVFAKKTIFRKKDDLINISSLSEEFMDNYFEEVSNVKEEDKENMIIVTSKDKLKDTYGAAKIIEAPNHQYFLQYDSSEDKNEALKKFESDDSNVGITENVVRKAYEDTVLVSSYNSWGVEAMGIDTLLEKLKNKELNDVVVAVIDTGLDVELFNKYFPGRLAGVYNALENNDNMSDDVGHGTHIAGTIAEATPASVKILSVKISLTEEMFLTDILTGINYVSYNKNADVMNMSFGSYTYSQEEFNAIQGAKNNNIISVAAAGNDNKSEPSYPASYVNAISIAAVDSTKTKANFSNYGSSIMFAAPGVNIKSLMREGSYYSSKEGDENWDGDVEFETIGGTSMATPHVVSVVANLKSLNKNLSFDDTITLLRRYSEDLGDSGWDEIFGYGFINFADADVCDGQDCDEFNVFKSSAQDNLIGVFDSYEIEPVLSQYDYGNINNIMDTKVKVRYTDGSVIEYKLCDIINLDISEYDSNSKNKQTINVSFVTPLGVQVEGSFDVTNPETYESVWEYELVGENSIEITNFKDSALIGNKLYFPSEIDGYTVVGIADRDNSMFAGNLWDSFKKIKYIYLPSTLTKIGNNAFSNKIVVGSSVQYLNGELNIVESDAEKLSIGDRAFMNHHGLYELTANVSYLGDYSLGGVSALQEIKFSDDITHIGDGAFGWAMTGGQITIPSTVTEIGEEVFAGDSISKILFLNDMETIPNGMFKNNWNLESIILPDKVTTISDYAFYHCNNLVSIRVPRDLTTIGKSAFEQAFKDGANAKTYIFENVTSVGDDAFKDIAPDAKLYVYNNSYIKSYANKNNVNYVQIDPDTITINGINSQYHAFDSIDIENVSIDLTYNEKNTRTETITENIEIVYPDSRDNFRYGDASVTVSAYYSLDNIDYPIEKVVGVEVLKLIPDYTVPTGFSVNKGQKLSQVELPTGFEWMDGNQIINSSGIYKAKFVPDDSVNYEIVENIDIMITVSGDLSNPIEIIANNYDVETNNNVNYLSIDLTIISNLNNLGLNSNYTVSVFEPDGETLKSSEKKVGTGNIIKVFAKNSNDPVVSYTVIIKGDLNGNGNVTAKDIVSLRQYIKNALNEENIDFCYLKAGDLNGNGKITAKDLVSLRQYIKEILNSSNN